MTPTILAIFLCLTIGGTVSAQDSLNLQLEAFRPYIGKTWRGVPPGASTEKPMIDVSRWERALNGQAIRVLHSINDGEYGGESIIFYDAQKKTLAYYYFTTAGFFTNGTMVIEDGKIVGDEIVTGSKQGITRVKSTSALEPDGRMHAKSEYLQNEKWIPGHEFFYVEDPKAEVVFK